MSKNICMISLGCDKNRVDAEIMACTIENNDFALVDDIAEADCAIINTCGFINSAKEESLSVIFDMLNEKADPESRLSHVVVTGCLAQRYCDELKDEIPELDGIVGIGHNGEIADILRRIFTSETYISKAAPEELPFCGKRFLSTPPHYAYLKIAEGCDNRCTYCAIPMIRGKYRSRKPEDVLAEARELVESGVKEIIIVAQDTTSYGTDLGIKSGLALLLRDISKIEGLWKVRLLYAYPDHLDDALIEVMAAESKIAKYIDIPLQHANGAVLKRMRRFGNSSSLKELIAKLRSSIPDITIRTTFMVGFPGETEEQFDELVTFAKDCEFNRAGCFEFSSEEGTPASRLEDDVTEEEKHRRSDILMQTLTGIIADERQAQIGRTFEAICDGFDEEQSMYIFRSEHDCPEVDTVIYALGDVEAQIGEIYNIEILDCNEYDLYGKIIL